MMPRFPGLSQAGGAGDPLTFQPIDLLQPNGQPLSLGFGPVGQNRMTYSLPKPEIHRDWGDLQLNIGPTKGPDAPAPVQDPANVLGATRPDLLVIPGQSAASGSPSGGGVTIGGIAILALLVVGGWLLYKKLRKA